MSTSTDFLAIGIDLGTTHCCVAFMSQNGTVDVIANENGHRTTPSYIVLTERGILVGKIAKEEYFKPPENVVYDSKRLIGRNFDDKYVQNDMKNWTFNVKHCNNKPVIELSFENEPVCYKPQEISAMLLDHMKTISQEYIGKPVEDAVITVPAHFNYHQRTATVEAGKLAGLNVLGIINEPTAAALAYIHKNNITEPKTVLVFDLGGGTFDVSIVKVQFNSINVAATAGNTHLGGRDFDNNLIDFVSEKIEEMFGRNVLESQAAKRRIKAACENLKIRLSSVEVAILDLPLLHNGEDVQLEITRKEFEDVNFDLFRSTIDIVQNCLVDAGMKSTDIDEIVLVGGSVRIPKIQQILSDFFGGKSLSKAINPDEAVAYGAAVQTARFNKSDKMEAHPTVIDVTPLSLGVDTHGGIMTVLISRNSTIPATATKTFHSVHDKQILRRWNIFEGERVLAHENILLGTCTLKVPPKPPGYPIDLIFCVDEDGILQVSAREGSGCHTTMSIAYENRDLTNVNDIILDAKLNQFADKQKESVVKKWRFLRNYCTKLDAVCDYCGENMTFVEKCTVKLATKNIYSWSRKNQVVHGSKDEEAAIEEKIKHLDEIWEPLMKKYGYDVKNLSWDDFYELISKAN